MGSKYEVIIFRHIRHGEFRDESVYYGDSLFGVVWARLKYRRHTGCMTIKIRG